MARMPTSSGGENGISISFVSVRQDVAGGLARGVLGNVGEMEKKKGADDDEIYPKQIKFLG
jgi:hypothetical protein